MRILECSLATTELFGGNDKNTCVAPWNMATRFYHAHIKLLYKHMSTWLIEISNICYLYFSCCSMMCYFGLRVFVYFMICFMIYYSFYSLCCFPNILYAFYYYVLFYVFFIVVWLCLRVMYLFYVFLMFYYVVCVLFVLCMFYVCFVCIFIS